jgi:hypothetical protein
LFTSSGGFGSLCFDRHGSLATASALVGIIAGSSFCCCSRTLTPLHLFQIGFYSLVVQSPELGRFARHRCTDDTDGSVLLSQGLVLLQGVSEGVEAVLDEIIERAYSLEDSSSVKLHASSPVCKSTYNPQTPHNGLRDTS